MKLRNLWKKLLRQGDKPMCEESKGYPHNAVTLYVSFMGRPDKTYAFAAASSLQVFKALDVVRVVDGLGAPVPARIQKVVKGISLQATKWRLGAPVTDAQRKANPYKQEKETNMNVTSTSILYALDTIKELQQEISKVSESAKVSVSTAGELIISGVSSKDFPSNKIKYFHEVQALIDFFSEDPAKVEARRRLASLEKEAADIRKLLEG